MNRTPHLDQQTIDIVNDNPLKKHQSTATQFNFKEKLKDPKLKLLFILSIVTVSLLFLTIVTAILKKKPTTTPYRPTPSPLVSPTPTINQTKIPEKWLNILDAREKELQINEDFFPPQLDTEIGIE